MGHRSPYTAVITLCVMAGYHWRSVRTRFLNDGIADPMALTSMHAMLDKVEAVVLEAVVSNAGNEKGAGKAAHDKFITELYTTPPQMVKLNGKTTLVVAPPEGFETPEAVEEGFTAFAKMLGGRRR